jgi:serine/threonine protein kinase
MGMVFEAEDLRLGRHVALKFLPGELSSDPDALQLFQREAQTASALNPPNLCTIYEIEEHDGHPFIAMELLEGETLHRCMTASQSMVFPVIPLADIATQVCDRLQAAHDKASFIATLSRRTSL